MRLFSAVIGLLLLASVAFAANGRFAQTRLSVQGSGEAQTVFTPDTPMITLQAEILEMPIGTKLTATLVAVKTDAASPNYEIASADLEINHESASDQTSFTLSKPDAGWPVGDYKVSLSINGQVATSLLFKIAPPGMHYVPATLENGKLVPGHFE